MYHFPCLQLSAGIEHTPVDKHRQFKVHFPNYIVRNNLVSERNWVRLRVKLGMNYSFKVYISILRYQWKGCAF